MSVDTVVIESSKYDMIGFYQDELILIMNYVLNSSQLEIIMFFCKIKLALIRNHFFSASTLPVLSNGAEQS